MAQQVLPAWIRAALLREGTTPRLATSPADPPSKIMSKKKSKSAAPKGKKTSKKSKRQTSDAEALMEKAFPMIKVIAEQIRTSIPPELVERVEKTKDKKDR